MTDIPITAETWTPCYRIVPSRYPPISLFERVADPADLEAVFSVEGLTNDRLRQEVGDLNLVPPEERQTGHGTTPIMAAFTHLPPYQTRFSDGSYGVYYASRSEATAIKETVYHRERFMRHGRQGPMDLEMRAYLSDVAGEFHDIRGARFAASPWYHPEDYSASLILGRSLREKKSWGILYNSVRHDGGECIGVFRTPVLKPCRQGKHYIYRWNGSRISDVLAVKSMVL